MKKTFKTIWKTMKVIFVVFCVYTGSLFFREERLPGAFAEWAVRKFLPDNLLFHVESVSFGFSRGLHLRDFRLYDLQCGDPLKPLVSAAAVDFNPFVRRILIDGLNYPRLPDGYYAEGNSDRNQPVEAEFPDWGSFAVTLVRPDVLSVRPERLTMDLTVSPRRIDFSRIQLLWPDRDQRMTVEGFCSVDLDRQEVSGEVSGLAKQAHIRPLLVAIDIPVALPYMDAFTEVPKPCPTRCSWKVDLVHNDLDLWLDLSPELGKYNGVSMQWAKGKIHLHNCTRDGHLNYVTTVGPIAAVDPEGRHLDGTVVIVGTNGCNTVDVRAGSAQPLADVLKIGGFEGDYVGEDVFGESVCDLQFRFPRSMTNNYEVLNGRGRMSVTGGRLMRMKGFDGLIKAMPSVAPAVAWFSDSTQASCDYVITNGVLVTDNACVEGNCFSVRMKGRFDIVQDKLDFNVLVQFAKHDSVVGKVLHPLTWPFSKLLLEFRLTGSPAEPKWRYLSVVDRVMEIVK